METRLGTIPEELKRLNQWLMWRYEQRGEGNPTKVPYQPNGRLASTTDSLSWSSFTDVMAVQGYDGIGIVFASTDPYVGIDLDDCISKGEMKPWGKAIIKRFSSYSEISPSGNGVKIWVKGKYPGEDTGKRVNYKDGKIEMYCKRRYFTVTGNLVQGAPRNITEQQSGIDGIYNKILCPPHPITHNVYIQKDPDEWVKRCVSYIDKCPDAVSGEGGHDRTYHVACVCQKFALDEVNTKRVMQWYSDTKCSPKWTEKEIEHKITSATSATRKDGSYGSFARQIGPPRVILHNPEENPNGLGKYLQEATEGKHRIVPFPWKILTESSRALLPKTLTVLCGLPGSTKSMMVSQACLYWLDTGVPFSVFHLEEDRDYHLRRALAQLAENSGLSMNEWCENNPVETMEAYSAHKVKLDMLSKCIWDAPASDIALTDLTDWVRDRAAEGSRVIIIDPVTAANNTDRPWEADRTFVLATKNIMRKYNSSLLVVTHPRDGQKATKNNIDNHAGGRAYSRFSQCLIDIEGLDKEKDKTQTIRISGACGTIKEAKPVNRIITVKKARNAQGFRGLIGGWFDGNTFNFEEHGLIEDE